MAGAARSSSTPGAPRVHPARPRLDRQADIVASAAAEELKLKSAIIDGELVYPHETGRSDFHALQAVVRSQSDRLVFMAFDLMHLDGARFARRTVAGAPRAA